MSRRQKGNIIYYIGLVGAILAPLIAAMTQFPEIGRASCRERVCLQV